MGPSKPEQGICGNGFQKDVLGGLLDVMRANSSPAAESSTLNVLRAVHADV